MTPSTRAHGFTLIETIITVVLVGIIGAFLVVFVGDKLTHSADPIGWAEDASAVEDTMERIVSDYVVAMNSASPSTALAGLVANESTYEGLLTTEVTFAWITFDGSGAEQAGVANDNLKVTVTKTVGGVQRYAMTTVLPTTRIQTSDEAVNY